MSQNPCPKCSADRPGLEDVCPNCGWRPEGLKPLPHGNAVAQSRQPVQLGLPFEAVSEPSRLKALWWAYFIAPVVAPVSFAVFFFVFGMAALAANPDHTGTPVAVLAVPAMSLTVGVVASYLAAGAIGMPVVLLLEKRKMLNGYTIHGAALASSIVFITLSCGLLYALVPDPNTPVVELAAFGAALFVFTAPSVLASATTFWWIVSRGFHGLSLRALIWTVTVIAILLGVAAPVLRVLF